MQILQVYREVAWRGAGGTFFHRPRVEKATTKLFLGGVYSELQ